MFNFSGKRHLFSFVKQRQKMSIKFIEIKIFVDLYATTFLIGIKISRFILSPRELSAGGLLVKIKLQGAIPLYFRVCCLK